MRTSVLIHTMRLVMRNGTLRWMVALPLANGIALRYLVSYFELEAYSPLLIGYIIATTPFLMGSLLALLMLDERDEKTLAALHVSPVSLTSLLLHRVALFGSLSLSLSIATLLIAWPPSISSLPTLLIIALATLQVPLWATLLLSLSKNKVQGLAVMKLLSTLLVVPIFSFFRASPWKLLFGIAPHFWPMQAFWESSTLWLLPGVVVNMIYVGVCFPRAVRSLRACL